MGEEQLENTVSILIQGKPNRGNMCSLLVGTCKPYVSQVIVSQTTGRGVSDTSK